MTESGEEGRRVSTAWMGAGLTVEAMSFGDTTKARDYLDRRYKHYSPATEL